MNWKHGYIGTIIQFGSNGRIEKKENKLMNFDQIKYQTQYLEKTPLEIKGNGMKVIEANINFSSKNGRFVFYYGKQFHTWEHVERWRVPKNHKNIIRDENGKMEGIFEFYSNIEYQAAEKLLTMRIKI